MHIVHRLLDLLLPTRCAGCDAPTREARILCAVCEGSLVPGAGASCPGCGLVYLTPPAGGAGHRCGACLRTPPPFHRATAAFAYGGALADAIARWKNAPDHTLGPGLARLFVDEAARAGWHPDPDARVVPVPTAPGQLRRRHFNPAGVLARAVARAHGLPLVGDAVAVRKAPGPSKGLDRKARLVRMRGVFAAVHKDSLAGHTVVLVDDVMTTGATVRAAAAACLRAGARQVEVLVLARAPQA